MPRAIQCCADFDVLSVLYAAGELEPSARAAMEAHVRACTDCAALLQREVQLAQGLASHASGNADTEPSDFLLARCRDDLSRALDEAAAEGPGWRSVLNPRRWPAMLSLNFHPAWSVAALLFVAAVSGLSGWQSASRAPLQFHGPALMTVSAAPPPPVSPAAPARANDSPAAPTVPRRTREAPARVYGNDGDVYMTGLGGAHRTDADSPLAWRHAPPPRIPDTGRLDGLSLRMQALLSGGLRVSPAEQQKRLLQTVPPEYPEVARRAGIEGRVTLGLRIGEDGSVEDVTLLSGEPVLGRAAAEAVEQWRYAPSRIDGQPVNILTSVTFDFELH